MISWKDIFSKRHDMSYIFDGEYWSDDATDRAYLKRYALDLNVNFIARQMAQAKFLHVKGGKHVKDNNYYRLNVRPNSNESATEFWEHVFHKLIYEAEVLIVITDTNELVVADSFVKDSKALYPDVYKGVVVKNYTYERTFSNDDVIYLSYQNKRLDAYTTALFGDYGEILGRMIEIQLRNNQIRGVTQMDLAQGTQADKQKSLQTFMDKVFKAFSNKSVAIVPTVKGMEYNELNNNTANAQQSYDQITKLKNDAVATVANILGIPEKLMIDQPAETSDLYKQFRETTLAFFYNLIESELNAKLISRSALLNGEEIILQGKNDRSIFDLAEQIDKITASGTLSPNEIRNALHIEKSNDPEMDKHYITKNYAKQTKGGDNSDED